MINPDIFKAYDIRGIYNVDFDDDFAYKLGLAYVALRQGDSDMKKNMTANKRMNIVVGYDMRLSSLNLRNALISGLRDAGANVIDIGLVSTPTFYFAVANFKYDVGLMISASHNPAEWNGFKMVRARAVPISGDTGIDFLSGLVIVDGFVKVGDPGELIVRDDILAAQIKHDLNYADIKKIKSLKIVADPASGMGAQYLEALFNYLPGELIKMNFALDGNFPAHEADPLKEENVKDLQAMVLSEQADLGIATDGDGDRVFFIDNNGKVINQAIIRGLLAKIFLRERPGAKIGYDVRPGKITDDLIRESGGRPMITRVGHSLIKEQMLREGAYFSGESSGHFFLNMECGCCEVPMIVILKLLQEFSASDQTIAEYVRPYQKYFSAGEINSDVVDKEAVLKAILEKYSDGRINRLDGISVTYPDFWFNVRDSNTENKMRLNLEAINESLMKTKTAEVLQIIKG